MAVLGVLLAVVSWSVNARPGRGLGSWWSWWQLLLIPPLFVAMVAWTAYAWISYPEPGGVMPPDVIFSFFTILSDICSRNKSRSMVTWLIMLMSEME